MRHSILFFHLLAVLILLPSLFALQLPESLASDTVSELDKVLQAARIELPSLTDGAPVQDQARSLITAAQKARLAIAAHVIDSPAPKDAGTASIRAKKLQDELMERVQSHLSTQLDQVEKVDEWGLYRGFRDGVVESKEALFTEHVLRPEKFRPVETIAEDAKFKERLRIRLIQVKAVLRDVDPIAAFRRWRIKRLLKKVSAQPVHPPTPPFVADVHVPSGNPTRWNIDQLRARLSSITALKSTQSQAAAAEAADAQAAQSIENAPVIHSDVVLPKEVKVKPEKMPKKIVNNKLPGSDGTKVWPGWVHTLKKVPVDGWDDIPIPGMAQ